MSLVCCRHRGHGKVTSARFAGMIDWNHGKMHSKSYSWQQGMSVALVLTGSQQMVHFRKSCTTVDWEVDMAEFRLSRLYVDTVDRK